MESIPATARNLVGLIAVCPFVVSVQAADWQLQRLMQPGPAQRAAEARGSVHIYESLEAGLVADAMDSHFDRIQNMMFIRIHHLPASGAGGDAMIEDDGCD